MEERGMLGRHCGRGDIMGYDMFIFDKFIMIAFDEEFSSIELVSDSGCERRTFEREIAKDINGIGWGDCGVPVFDERGGHFVYGLKRSVANSYDVVVTEMLVGGEKNHMDLFPFLFIILV